MDKPKYVYIYQIVTNQNDTGETVIDTPIFDNEQYVIVLVKILDNPISIPTTSDSTTTTN